MLCEEGGAVDFFESGAPWRDGTTPVNVSGGLQSKGHPISATGIANIWEICHHLRGEAGDRQIEGAKVGLAHVIGLGSNSLVRDGGIDGVVIRLARGFSEVKVEPGNVKGIARVTHTPPEIARRFARAVQA